MAAKRDYYEVLGVPRSASEADVKRAFRDLAKRHHPDVAQGDRKENEERFKEISEAYEVLADGQKRATYDRFGHEGMKGVWGSEGFTPEQFTHLHDLEDIFGSFGGDLFSTLFGGRPRRTDIGSDIRVDIQIPLEKAATGSQEYIKIPRVARCVVCKGSGARSPRDVVQCRACGGTGQVRRTTRHPLGQVTTIVACGECRGAGQSIRNPCESCRGQGSVRKEETVNIRIPAGIEDGTRLQASGMGAEDPRSGRPGDLYVVVHVQPHGTFERFGKHLALDVPITFSRAALGGEVEVPLLNGSHTRLRVPPGTQGGEVLVIEGMGLPAAPPDPGRRGDLHVRVSVHVPKDLASEERRLLEEFERLQQQRRPGIFGKVKQRLKRA
jgi:molecular chaperone DnaJ